MTLAYSLRVAFKTEHDVSRTYQLKVLNQEPNDGRQQAAKDGDTDLIHFFIQKGAYLWDFGMRDAAQGGHTDLVHFFIEKGADDWSEQSSNPTSERW